MSQETKAQLQRGKSRKIDRTWVVAATGEPGHHFLPEIIKYLLKTPSLISSSQRRRKREKDSAAISFQGFGVCGAAGGIWETEEPQLRNPAERLLHPTPVPSRIDNLLFATGVLRKQQSILKVAFRTLHRYSCSLLQSEVPCLFDVSGIFHGDFHVHLGLSIFPSLESSPHQLSLRWDSDPPT